MAVKIFPCNTPFSSASCQTIVRLSRVITGGRWQVHVASAFLLAIIIGLGLGESTCSRFRLTEEPRDWYVQILGTEPLI